MARIDDIEVLSAFGATASSVVGLSDSIGHRELDYLDLPGLRSGLPRVTSVVEMGGRAVLYVVRGPLSGDVLEATCHVLAQRGAADHLGVVEPGRLTLVPLVPTSNRRPKTVWEASSPEAHGKLPALAFGMLENNAPATSRRLHDKLVDLLTKATAVIVDEGGVPDPADALSLVGRALFLRFLIDRDIVGTRHLKEICPQSPSLLRALDSPDRITTTSRWLDEAFNGNLLPLSTPSPEQFWRVVRKQKVVCDELAKILCKSDPHGQMHFDWETLDFGHIPVGLLSQVYERWCHVFAREKAIRDSVWYTPRSIAEYVVDEAFYNLPNGHTARVLDPAVGAGVFLVAAYRELARARWRHDGVRPSRRVLREILYGQLAGFDVNESSLRLTALALYLTALELDPEPQSRQGLRFADLRERGVLHDVRGPYDQEASDLPLVGSLGPHISAEHRGRYDVVLGNPPWTAWASEKSRDPRVMLRRRSVEAAVTPIVRERLATEAPDDVVQTYNFEMVDFAPDLAFCWRAIEWAKPQGVIALALHARLLFRQSPTGISARNHLFGAVSLSGILNGSALAQTQVWPSHEAPFCLFFATNRRPGQHDAFQFVSPVVDRTLNKNGYLRVDAAASQSVRQLEVIENPWLLKTRYRGTPLDLEIMRRLTAVELTVGGYWDKAGLNINRGYIQGGENASKRDITHLLSLPDLSSWEETKIVIPVRELPRFEPRPLSWPRSEAAFTGPLVVVFDAPRHDRSAPRARIALSSVAYDDSFHGFSTAGHPSPKLLASYLLILFNSNLVLYFALMRSGMFGASRKRLLQTDLCDFPFRAIEELSEEQVAELKTLSNHVLSSHSLPQNEIDDFVGSLYGLTQWDLQTIRDTLDTSLPFASSMMRAQEVPTPVEIDAFVQKLHEIIEPVLDHVGRRTTVELLSQTPSGPWFVLRVATLPSKALTRKKPSLLNGPSLAHIWTIARDAGASRVVWREQAPGSLLVAIFAQYRYWTATQARQLALDLLGSTREEPWLRGADSDQNLGMKS